MQVFFTPADFFHRQCTALLRSPVYIEPTRLHGFMPFLGELGRAARQGTGLLLLHGEAGLENTSGGKKFFQIQKRSGIMPGFRYLSCGVIP